MIRKRFSFVVMLACLIATPILQAGDNIHYSSRHQNDNLFIVPGSGEAMVLDALVFRPIGLVTTVIGGVVFLVSLPFSALGGNVGEAADKLIVEPIDYTFKRKLGDLEY